MMLRYGGLIGVIGLMLSVGITTRADDPKPFEPLFNGKGFTGWKFFSKDAKADPKKTWSVADGVILCTGKPNGYIMTEKEYSNYELRVKWRFPAGSKGGNSGVLLHCTGPDKIWPYSVEAQLKAGFAGDLWLVADEKGQLPTLQIDPARKDPANKEGRHYFRMNASEAVEKPFGEWNQYEITCQDGNITLKVNGKLANVGKDGSLKKGRILLQSEGAEIQFKEIEIREFPKK